MNNSTFGGVVATALASVMIASTTWWYIRLQISGGWFSASGDPSTVLPALAIVFLGAAVPFFLNGSGRFNFPFTRNSTVVVFSVALLVTLSTGLVLSGEFITPAAVWWDTYGFPLTWRVDVMHGCPPWCNLPSTSTTFNPVFFAIDSAFYLAIGLAAVQVYKPLGRRILSSTNLLRQFVAHHQHIGPKTLAALLIVLASIATVETTMLWTAAAPTGGNCTGNLICNPQKGARLSMAQFWANSPTNATLKIMNYGPDNVTLQSYSVTDGANNQYLKSSWSGPTINPGVMVAFFVTIDGIGFTYGWGGMYTIKITTVQGGQYSFSTGQLGINIQYGSLNTTTTAILTVANTGPPTISFNAYKVRDPSGLWSNNTSWAGPTVGPGMTDPADITIDGQSFTFQTGATYTIQLYDTTGTEWTTYITP